MESNGHNLLYNVLAAPGGFTHVVPVPVRIPGFNIAYVTPW